MFFLPLRIPNLTLSINDLKINFFLIFEKSSKHRKPNPRAMKNLQFTSHLYAIVAVTSILILITSCNSIPPLSKKAYIKQFIAFVNDVELNYKAYTKENWEKADARFEKLAEKYYDKYKNKMTEDEILKINKLKGKYLGFRMKGKSKKDLLLTTSFRRSMVFLNQ